jgi:AcrR family transcriptional regulator
MERVSPSTRDALLDAAYDAAVAGTWSTTRMADVAAAAGVSRQTLYNEFGSKDGIAAALSARETERFLAGTARAVDGHADPVDAVRAAVAWTLAAAAENPLLEAVLTGTAPELLPYLTTHADAVYGVAVDRIAGHIAARSADTDQSRIALAAEVSVRLTVSYLVSPRGPVEETADRVARVVGSVIGSVIDTAGGPRT